MIDGWLTHSGIDVNQKLSTLLFHQRKKIAVYFLYELHTVIGLYTVTVRIIDVNRELDSRLENTI